MLERFRRLPLALSFDDVLIVPQYSEVDSRIDVNLTTKISSYLTLDIPLITTNMDTVTGVEMAIAMGKMGGLSVLPRWDRPETQADKVALVKKKKVRVGASVGTKSGFKERAEMLAKAGVDFIEIDTAHGHLKKALEATRTLVEMFKGKITIYGGIIATREAAEDYFRIGVDGVNVGIGGGSICTTRVQTGCGVPGFASLLEVGKAARKHKGYFMPLAGIETSGDIVKALAVGSCAIRGGNIFAGTDEAPGDILVLDGRKYKRYSGSTSEREKLDQIKKYSSDKSGKYAVHIEGVEGYVEYKGSIESVVDRLLAGVRSGISYSGGSSILELQKKAKFIRVTNSGIAEGRAHHLTQISR